MTSVFRFALRVLRRDIIVNCADQESFELLRQGYSAFLTEANVDPVSALDVQVLRLDHKDGWILQCDDKRIRCRDTADLIYDFEKSMTLWIQKRRPEIFFAHAAALSIDNRCVIISGASGSGKSSLAWKLGHLGFSYLSDELAPIDPAQLHVEPYPHALCLKTEPPSGPSLPKSTIRTVATMHVPAYELPNHELERPSPIAALVFIDASRNGRSIETNEISRAEAAARLYSNGLNQLAHVGDGLPAVTRIAGSVPSVLITGGTVEERSGVILSLF